MVKREYKDEGRRFSKGNKGNGLKVKKILKNRGSSSKRVFDKNSTEKKKRLWKMIL